LSKPKAKFPLIRVTSRKSIKAANRLQNEYGVQRAAAARRAQAKVDGSEKIEWTEETVRKMVEETVRKK
jgi:hypothetical protein